MILQKAIEQQGRNTDISGALADFLTNYAEILASQGYLTAALTYLGNSDEVINLDLMLLIFVSMGDNIEVLLVLNVYSIVQIHYVYIQ